MATFEQPLNERIRSFTRLQQLFNRINHHCGMADSEWDIHAAVMLVLDLYDMTCRLDLKSEIMKELDRQNQSLNQFSGSSQIDSQQLATITQQQRDFIEQLHAQKGPITQHIQNNEFLNNIRQRCAASATACSYDLPVYYHWLKQPKEQCLATIDEWIRPYKTPLLAIDQVLDTIRQSTHFEETVARDGFFQQPLTGVRTPQLVRVRVNTDLFPEISGSKHRMSVRFFHYISTDERTPQTTDDVSFQLALCSI